MEKWVYAFWRKGLALWISCGKLVYKIKLIHIMLWVRNYKYWQKIKKLGKNADFVKVIHNLPSYPQFDLHTFAQCEIPLFYRGFSLGRFLPRG